LEMKPVKSFRICSKKIPHVDMVNFGKVLIELLPALGPGRVDFRQHIYIFLWNLFAQF